MTGDTPTSARRISRTKIFQPGEMHTISGSQRVHLLDLSASGALVYTAGRAPDAGTVVRLIVAGTVIGAARVRWAVGKRFGVSFATPLSTERLDELIDVQRSIVRKMGEQPVIPAPED
jgi:hypothetical protein